MKRSLKHYEKTLTDMVEMRKGVLDPFLAPQIRITAQCWRMLDTINDQLSCADLIFIETGSNGQVKNVVNPLLVQYEKLSRTLKLHFSSLGINYDSTPSKVCDVDGASDKNDPLVELIKGM